MGYYDWFEKHRLKHERIVRKLQAKGFDKEAIIAYFDFENMRRLEVDFCPLYAKNKKCHDIESLNCYLCACPNFRFNDEGIDVVEGKTRMSYCAIDSKDGRAGVYGEKIHQNCSACTIPHERAYIDSVFDLRWQKIMQACPVKNGD